MTIGRLFWFHRCGEDAGTDGYHRATRATAAFLQANGTEVWPVLSSNPEQDRQDWLDRAGTVVRVEGEDRRLGA